MPNLPSSAWFRRSKISQRSKNRWSLRRISTYPAVCMRAVSAPATARLSPWAIPLSILQPSEHIPPRSRSSTLLLGLGMCDLLVGETRSPDSGDLALLDLLIADSEEGRAAVFSSLGERGVATDWGGCSLLAHFGEHPRTLGRGACDEPE